MAALPAFARCRRKFRRYFPDGFRDADYLAWERDYKWQAHVQWQKDLPQSVFRRLLKGDPLEIARRAVRIESRTNLLFSFEKMALRDTVRGRPGAARFAHALYALLHGDGSVEKRFDFVLAGNFVGCPNYDAYCNRDGWHDDPSPTGAKRWGNCRAGKRACSPGHWRPSSDSSHSRASILKPMVTRRAASRCDCAFHYVSHPGGHPYAAYLKLARAVRTNLADWKPRDLMDIQSFLWVQGSDEYP